MDRDQPDGDGAPTAQIADSAVDPAPDSYSGLLTPTTMWWVLVGITAIAAGNVYAFLFGGRQALVAAVMAGFLALLAIGTGYGDASWRYPIARGQGIQFGITSFLTAGSFALAYLIAYYAGQRRPLRSKHSMEYLAHPRHQEMQK